MAGFWRSTSTRGDVQDAALILGPGEAKDELKKRMKRDKPAKQIITMEIADKMTDRQVAARTHAHFQE